MGKRVLSLVTVAAFGLLVGLLLVEFTLRYQQRAWVANHVLASRLPYYQTDAGAQLWEDYTGASTRYAAYTVWEPVAYTSDTVNVVDGVRYTPGTQCDTEDPYTVFVFGGSTVFGYATPDDQTIAAYLQQHLTPPTERPLCVVNYGVEAYNSTQDVIYLLKLVQQGITPDLAIFYGGVNDVFSAFNAGIYRHAFQTEVARRVDVPWDWLRRRSFIYAIAYDRYLAEGPAPDPADLAAITQIYTANHRTAEAIADEFNFEIVIFWQPALPTTSKPLTETETEIFALFDVEQVTLHQTMHTNVQQANISNWYDLTGVFAETEETVWIDELHITPAANEAVALAIVEQLGF